MRPGVRELPIWSRGGIETMTGKLPQSTAAAN
jgi:hypothetical protein